MKDLIEQIVKIIGDYRKDDIGFFYHVEVDQAHVERWVNQFEEKDREFILAEFLHLLPNSYLTKENTLRILTGEFETLRKDFGYDNVESFLDETVFLNCQEEGKSQKILLQFVDEILNERYGYSLKDCGSKTIRNWVYLDDVLASGGTFREDIEDEIENFGVDKFKVSGIRIIGSFVILHSWAMSNVRFRLKTKYEMSFETRLKYYAVATIENNPNINYFNPNPSFNHIFPVKSELGNDILLFIEQSFDRKYPMRNEGVAFRRPEYPKNEAFFSNAENRIRYENLLLDKGFEILRSIDNLTAESLRPLGMTPPSYKTLGTGTHFFTWRNISNTCPIVFWWGSNSWYPLFPVKNRGLYDFFA